MNNDETRGELILKEDLSDLSTDVLIEKIGVLANSAVDRKTRERFQEAIALSEAAKKRELSRLQLAELNYAVANAWGGLHQLSISGEADVWKWEQEAIEKPIEVHQVITEQEHKP